MSENQTTDGSWKRFAPGKIVVSRADHRRLLEECGQADNPRIEFVSDAAAMDGVSGGE